jgi:endonuclease/exonuclease/phosphatase family metal-dependent hydrolase
MLKIVTLNMNYDISKHGPWEQRRLLIRDAILMSDADVVALQAVRRDPGSADRVDQATQLARLLAGYEFVVFRPAAGRDNGIADGSAIVSRVEIGETDYLQLSLRPGLEDANPRVLLHARFDLPGGPFHLFDVHFSWVPEQASDNVNEAIPFVNSNLGPGLLVGDMNTTRESGLLDHLESGGWTDLWEKLRPGEDGFTFESNDPAIRIDYAWANADLAPNVQRIDIVGEAQDTGSVRMSDHLGLAVTLDLEKWAE